MAEAEDCLPLWPKQKAISALLPYAVWQERDGQPEMLDAVLHAVRASKVSLVAPGHVNQFISTLLSEASPRVIILVAPHMWWTPLKDRGDLVQWWAATASTVPYTEEVAQGVVDTLLQIAIHRELVQYIPVDIWSWLTRRPSLPPICWGRSIGTYDRVVKVVRGLKDIEVLKSYLLLVWSEWSTPHDFGEMCTSIQEDFGGIGLGSHRADLIQRLDHVLGQLDRRSECLTQHCWPVREGELQERMDNYRKLRETLLGTDTKVLGRTSCLPITLLRILTPTLYGHRIPHNIYVRIASRMSIVSRLECSVLPLHALFVPPALRYHPPDSLHLPAFFLSSLSYLELFTSPSQNHNVLRFTPILVTVPARISMHL